MCMSVCLCEFMHTTCLQENVEARREHQIPCNLSYRQLCDATWVLGTGSRSFVRVASTCNC